ncbi:hypothetical protein Q4519_10575 [Motilimonas sp. 1_MG-2023]|uniref:hypothetical protein n=1 Tax=Motilimonas sp. 1_MG-2023 TaxID=3062672 RepID=UPI0026E1CC6C|nr:hypothetical protein [Motilimonas sp. 1_MG-2023]MDO6526125.1 hypothetical protein [Motilimonas sp. 1_MG-2023]
MFSFPDLTQFAAAYPTLSGTRLDLAHRIAKQSYNETCFFNQQLNQHKLAPEQWAIELIPQSTPAWIHQIVKSAKEQHYQFENSLTLAASCLSSALELSYLTVCANENKIAKSRLQKDQTSLTQWFADTDQADEASIKLALDAALLLYFHQVSQVMFGHAALAETTLVERRALITDADFNAGTMFCLWLDYHQDKSRIPANEADALQRLVNAAYLLSVIDKSQANNKNSLHFASNRVSCFVSGAIAGLHEMGKGEQFSADEDTLQQQTAELSQWIEAALLDSSLGNFVGNEAELEADEQKLQGETASNRERLKAGPLQKLAF